MKEFRIITLDIFVCSMILLFSLLIGCTPFISSQTNDIEPTSEMVSTSPTVITPTLFVDEEVNSSVEELAKIMNATVLPTRTVEPTATSTTRPTPSMTPSPVATLTRVERQEAFFLLAQTNGGCVLPCWWGVDLGENLESVRNKFAKMGMPWLEINSLADVQSDKTGRLRLGLFEEIGDRLSYLLTVTAEFHELDDIIALIFVRADRPIYELGQEELIENWDQYYLDVFLQKYGQPDKVYFYPRSIADLMIPPQFSIRLLYLEKGISITYHLDARWLDEDHTRAEVCLSIEHLRAVELALFIPEQYEVWKSQLAPFAIEAFENFSWEAEFDEPITQFYEKYQSRDNLRCLITMPN